jgi:RNA polymerase-binding transcription factor DksA
MLTPEQIERFRTVLLEERAAAEARIQDRSSVIPAAVRQQDDVVDPIDEAAGATLRDEAVLENQMDQELVERIDHALERIEQGTYGISEVSDQPIPLERLEAVPWATTLVDERPPDREA